MTRLSIEPNERITYKVRYQDADVVVVNKPSGVVTLPGLGHDRDTLLNGLFAAYGPRLQNLGRARDFGLLHRLDRETSGLVMVALTPRAYDALRADFEQRRIRKYYWAVVSRAPSTASGVIRRPIDEYEGKAGGDPRTRKLARVSAGGKAALTAFRVLAAGPLGAVLECRAVTGRLHQVRVHLEFIGCPILGDDAYGPNAVRRAASRLALHAHRLVFTHPVTGAEVDVESPWPKDLRALLRRLNLKVEDGAE
jgi:23S rRNA pseudouridine1911/1915/1917 synthase